MAIQHKPRQIIPVVPQIKSVKAIKSTTVRKDEKNKKSKKVSPKAHVDIMANGESKTWTSNLSIVNACGLLKAPQAPIFSLFALAQVILLMKKYRHQEWLADLIGTIDEKTGACTVTKLVIPEQEASEVFVERKGAAPKGCIGILHSHHEMGTHFSPTDINKASVNHKLTGVVSSNLRFRWRVRMRTQCNHLAFQETEGVTLEEPFTVDELKKIENGDRFFKPSKVLNGLPYRAYANGQNYGYGYGFGYRQGHDYRHNQGYNRGHNYGLDTYSGGEEPYEVPVKAETKDSAQAKQGTLNLNGTVSNDLDNLENDSSLDLDNKDSETENITENDLLDWDINTIDYLTETLVETISDTIGTDIDELMVAIEGISSSIEDLSSRLEDMQARIKDLEKEVSKILGS